MMNPNASSFSPSAPNNSLSSGFSANAPPFQGSGGVAGGGSGNQYANNHAGQQQWAGGSLSAASPSYLPPTGSNQYGPGQFNQNSNMGGGGGGYGHRPHQGGYNNQAPHNAATQPPNFSGNRFQQQQGAGYGQQPFVNEPQRSFGNPQQSIPPQHQQQRPVQEVKQTYPTVVLLLDTDSTERELVASHLSQNMNYYHIAVPFTETDPEEVTYKYNLFQSILQKYQDDVKANPEMKNQGVVVEVKMTYHYVEIFYYFDLMRKAKVFPTHIALLDHSSLLTIPHSKEYDFDQCVRHPLPFEACMQVLSACEENFDHFSEFSAHHNEDLTKNESMIKLIEFLKTTKPQLTQLPEHEPQGVFKSIPLLPDTAKLVSATDKLMEFFQATDPTANPSHYAQPTYVLDYGTLSRNAFQLPNYYSTTDLNGTNTILAKVDGQFFVLFPKCTALGVLKPEMVPEALRQMKVDAAATGTSSPAASSPTSIGVDYNADSGIAWVINATILHTESVDQGDRADCTIFAKDIIMANGVNVSQRSFAARNKILSDLVPETPSEDTVIVVRQRYYNALDTSKLFQKIDGGLAAGNGLWFVNPGKAQLRKLSSWNYKFSLPDGGFDARLWNATDTGEDVWNFDILILNPDGIEESIGSIQIANDTVGKDGLNDGQIVRILMKRESPAPEAPAPGGKKGNAKNASKQPPPEPKIVYQYMNRQHWIFTPTADNPTQQRYGKKHLLEALEALK
eukprot:GILI01010448.1.p1 GENE.GILI01010448.1~~GILI01010448.1.p1  ORF type:complete len:734 (+),score=152.22 GILI01010448.1:173-2374(+)